MDETEFQAAERALSLEPPSAETAEEARLREAWERRLAPLLTAPAEPPPPGLLARIEAALDASDGEAPVPPPQILRLRRQVRRWKLATGAALAAAAALALYIAAPAKAPPPAARYVAVVADETGRTGLIIQFDAETGAATVIPTATPPDSKSYEIWTVPAGAAKPVSLGLLPREAVVRTGLTPAPDQIFAVSLEPKGGSPTGEPTTLVYQGRVVRVE